MAGRRPKTPSQKDSAGNPGHRPIPVELDFSSAGAIKMPSWLDADAKKEWRRIVKALSDLDLLKATDVGVVASYCTAYSRWVASERKIAVDGTVLKTTGSQGQEKWIKHPALMVASEAQKQMLRAGSLLGLNPVDRVRIAASPKQANNPFAALLAGDEEDEPAI